MQKVRLLDALLMRLLINTSWSREGEKFWLGIDVQGLTSFYCFVFRICFLFYNKKAPRLLVSPQIYEARSSSCETLQLAAETKRRPAFISLIRD